jgi:ribonuclease D
MPGTKASNRNVVRGGGLIAVAVFCVAAGSGCAMSAQLQKQAVLNELRCVRFVDLMRRSETTRDQERDFIVENQHAWTAVRAALGADSALEDSETRGGLIPRLGQALIAMVPRVWLSIPYFETRYELRPEDRPRSRHEPSVARRSD